MASRFALHLELLANFGKRHNDDLIPELFNNNIGPRPLWPLEHLRGDPEYLSTDEYDKLNRELIEIKRMVNAFIQKDLEAVSS